MDCIYTEFKLLAEHNTALGGAEIKAAVLRVFWLNSITDFAEKFNLTTTAH